MPTPVEAAELRIEDLTVRYRGLPALSGVSLRAPAGAVVSVLGANGAGKSTLLKAITGAVRCDGGSIRLGDEELVGRPVHKIARLGVFHLPEGRGLFRALTVRENLLLAAPPGGDADEREAALARLVERFPVLAERASSPASSLSGGQQQMLAIARAVLMRPRLILIDELSFGLAPVTAARAFEFLEELNTELGATVLLVEQNVGHALARSSHAYVLKTGHVAMEGPSEELSSNRDLLFTYLGAEAHASTAEAS